MQLAATAGIDYNRCHAPPPGCRKAPFGGIEGGVGRSGGVVSKICRHTNTAFNDNSIDFCPSPSSKATLVEGRLPVADSSFERRRSTPLLVHRLTLAVRESVNRPHESPKKTILYTVFILLSIKNN